MSEQDFLALPESTDRIELLDGEVIVPPSPSDGHQHLTGQLYAELLLWARRHPPTAVRIAPLDVRFGPGRILQPDVFVVLSGIPAGASTPLGILPDLCVEVLSSRRSYDRIVKRHVYAESGVREYWVVDPEERCVEIYQGPALLRTVHDVLVSALLPDFSLDLRSIL